jgi:hypothetical protein
MKASGSDAQLLRRTLEVRREENPQSNNVDDAFMRCRIERESIQAGFV